MLQGTTTSLQGDITDLGSLVFDQDFTGTFAGDISGNLGSLTKQGTGKAILTGSNSYQRHPVSGGILQGDTDSLQRNIIDNANVTFDQAADGTFSGIITGSGSADQDRHRHADLHLHLRLHRRHDHRGRGAAARHQRQSDPFVGAVVANGSGGLTVPTRIPVRSRP